MTYEEPISITRPVADLFLAEMLRLRLRAGELVEAVARLGRDDDAELDLAPTRQPAAPGIDPP